jgi:hypothetical protein
MVKDIQENESYEQRERPGRCILEECEPAPEHPSGAGWAGLRDVHRALS